MNTKHKFPSYFHPLRKHEWENWQKQEQEEKVIDWLISVWLSCQCKKENWRLSKFYGLLADVKFICLDACCVE